MTMYFQIMHSEASQWNETKPPIPALEALLETADLNLIQVKMKILNLSTKLGASFQEWWERVGVGGEYEFVLHVLRHGI